jgi:hypothetical protein
VNSFGIPIERMTLVSILPQGTIALGVNMLKAIALKLRAIK